MKFGKKVLSFMLCLMIVLGCAFAGSSSIEVFDLFALNANAASLDDLTYEINDGQVTITDCDEYASGEMIIPDKIEGCDVTAIAAEAFKNCMSITKLVVPDSVTSIAVGALNNMVGLEELQVPFIGISRDATAFNAVFGAVFGYTTVVDNSTDGSQTESTAFRYSTVGSNSTATWQYSCYNYKYLFYHSSTQTSNYWYRFQSYYYYIPASLTTVTITDDDNVSTAAFMNCNCLETINLNSDINVIENYACRNCSSLYIFNSSDSVKTIGNYAFCNCNSLASFNNTNGLQSIGEHAFESCYALKNISLCQELKTIGQYAFQNCTSMTQLVIPERLDSIGRGALRGMTSLESLSIPFVGLSRTAEYQNSVFGIIFDYGEAVDVGNWKYYSSPNYAYVPDVVGNPEHAVCQYSAYSTRAGNHQANSGGVTVYSYCLTSYWYLIPSSLKTVYLTNSSSINKAAFKNCGNLTKIDISKKVNNVGTDAFYGCEGVLIYGQPDSALESYCENKGLEFRSTKSAVSINICVNDEIPQYVGQPVNAAALSLECLLYDGTTETIDSGFEVIGELSKTRLNLITVRYDGLESEVYLDAIGVENISVIKPFDKMDYNEMDKVKPDGLELEAIYKDGNSFNVDTGYTINTYTVINLEDESVKINYYGATTALKINVIHQFVYHYNNDATYDHDGTETEICEICQKVGQTRKKEGTRINPTAIARLSVKSDEVYKNSKVTVKAKATGVPEGYLLAIYDGGNIPVAVGDNKSVSYQIPGELTSNKTMTVKIIDKSGNVQKDANGKELIGRIEIKIKSGFFNIIIAFFKKLFGSNIVAIEP